MFTHCLIDNLLDMLSKVRFLSAIELASGYHKIKLADDAVKKLRLSPAMCC